MTVRPFHVAAWIEDFPGSKLTVKQKLAAVRMLYDFLAFGKLRHRNPAHSVRGPKYVVKKGKTPVWSREDAKTLLDSMPKDSVSGLRDMALIAAMFYSFARVCALRIGTVKNSKNFFLVDGPARSMRTGAWKDWAATTASSVSDIAVGSCEFPNYLTPFFPRYLAANRAGCALRGDLCSSA
jgi:site-specific recombinase XerD